ncbi:hypothetical protein ACFO4E_01625 [Nocardiopsis mangrovi]|uniref:DUF3352 domain-containing protein n=1 Tax=Nocardiopsis mangrovi TaxID=1179818 RepID=A0ABV9DQ20_9ACTN
MGTGYPPQQPYAAPPRRSRVWMVPVAAGLGVALLATTVWASTSMVSDLFGGPQPETVLPASAVVFAKVDLKPSGGQLANYAQFVGRLPDSIQDEIDPEADPAEEVVSSMVDELGVDMDYEQDFEPWLGRRFGVAAWPAADPAAEASDGLAVAFALAVEDEDAANAALGRLEDEAGGFTFEVRDGFALLAPNDAALTELRGEVDRAPLADDGAFAQDMDVVGGDSIAAAWMDVEAAAGLASSELGEAAEATGRIAIGLNIEAEYAELRGDMFDVGVDGVSLGDYATEDRGLELMGDLPDDTVMALGANGLDSVVERLVAENPEDFGDVEAALSEVGLAYPDGLTQLLGTRTAVGVTDPQGLLSDFMDFGGTGSSSTPSMQLRALGADAAALEDIIAQSSANSYEAPPGVNTDGDAVVVSSGTSGTGRLGDDPVYQRTMQGMEEASAGFYLDLRPFAEDAGESGPEQWGSMGGSLTVNENDASILARWAPSGGG